MKSWRRDENDCADEFAKVGQHVRSVAAGLPWSSVGYERGGMRCDAALRKRVGRREGHGKGPDGGVIGPGA